MTIKGKMNFGDVIRGKLKEDADLRKQVELERYNLDVAQEIYDARTRAGLKQRDLAEAVGTSQSAIARLEDADYDGHTLKMLKRIADALDCRVRVELVPRPVARDKVNEKLLTIESHEISWDIATESNDFWHVTESAVKQG